MSDDRPEGLPRNDDLIVVDENDEVVGHRGKADCHDGGGILHRAFSIFILNPERQLLLQKRSAEKRLWPLYWSNSCCSHPRRGESMAAATVRRLREELGIAAPLRLLFKIRYRFAFANKGSENELTSVFAGRSEERIVADPAEVAEWKFVDLAEMESDLARHPERYTPWFRKEWDVMRRNHLADILAP